MSGLRKGGSELSDYSKDIINIPAFLSSRSPAYSVSALANCTLTLESNNVQNDGFDLVARGLSCDWDGGDPPYNGRRKLKIYVYKGGSLVSQDETIYLPKPYCSGCYDYNLKTVRGLSPKTTYTARVEFWSVKKQTEINGSCGQEFELEPGFKDLLATRELVVTTLEEACDWGLSCTSESCNESCNESCSEECPPSSDCFYCLSCESSQCNGQWTNFSNLRLCALQNDSVIPTLPKPPSGEINRYTCIWFSLTLGNDACAFECSSVSGQCMFSSSYPTGYFVCTKLEFYIKKDGDSDFYLSYTDSNASNIGAGRYCYYNFIAWDLEPDTLYTIKVLSYNSDNVVNREIIQSCRTAAYPPTAEVRQITDRTAQIAVKNLSSNYIYLRRYDYYVNGTKWDSATDTSTGAKEFWHWLYGLTPNVEYTFVVKMYRSDTGDYLDEVSCKGTTHTKFEWDVPKVQGQKIVVTATEWNRLIDYTNGSYNRNISKVSTGSKITAATFNAIASVVGCATVTKDTTKISAKAFNDLRDAYNSGQST